MYKILYLPDSKFIKMGVFALILNSLYKSPLFLLDDFISKTHEDAENQLKWDLVRWENCLTPDEKNINLYEIVKISED